MIVNQLDHGSNTANLLFPNPAGEHDGDMLLYNYSCATGGLSAVYFDSSSPSGFDDTSFNPVAAPTLAPGAGFFYRNVNAAFSNTFTGVAHVPTLPPTNLPCGYNATYLLGRQTNDIGNYTNITGLRPSEGAMVATWTGVGYVTNRFTNGTWTLGEPSLAVGHAAKFFIPSPLLPASFSNLTPSQSITYGSPFALSGTVSGPGPVYPSPGETVTVTINGGSQNTTINDGTGDFSLVCTCPPICASNSPFPYSITYTYAGDSTLSPATNSATMLTVLASYSVNIHSGLNLIANQLDHGSNTLNDIMPMVPDASLLSKFNNSGSNWLTAIYSASFGGWTPGNITLSPGEGAFFQSPTNFTLTFHGTPHVPVLPVAIPGSACYLLSRQTNDIGDYTSIVGLPPNDGARVYKYTGGYTVFVFDSIAGTWTPSEPTAAVGESVWIAPAGGAVPAPVPTNTFVAFQGLLNESLGSASLSVNATSNQLAVGNLGSSGQNGVAITLPPNTAGLVVGWLDLDVSNTLPVGAYLQSQVVGTGNGVSGVLGKLTVTKAGTSNYVMSADYSPLGASTYTVASYLRGVLQAQAINQSGTSLATANIPPKGKDLGDRTVPLSEEWWTNALVSIGTGPAVLCDELIVSPENVTSAVVPTALQIVASQIPGFSITNETIILVQQGLLNASLGKAALSASGDTLTVANIGSSGQDGVSIAANCTTCNGLEDVKNISDGAAKGQASDLVAGMEVAVNEIGPTNAVPVGAAFQARVVGTLDGVTYGPLGALILTKTGSSNFLLSADFSPVGTTNYTIEIYQSGVLVRQLTNQNSSSQVGIAVSDQADPTESTGKKKKGRHLSYAYVPRFGQNTNVVWGLSGSGLTFFIGGAEVPGDDVNVKPERVTFTSAPTAFQITASQSPTVTLTSENVSLVYQGLTNSSLRHASLAVSGNQMTVSNIGSSGMDGVSVAIPDYAVGIALSCPPSSGTNIPPLGAYFQSQLVGTAGSVSNDVLGTLTVTYLGPTNYAIAADFSAVGASNYTVEAYSHGALVGRRMHQPTSLASADIGPDKLDWDGYPRESMSSHFPTTAQVMFGDGTTASCDELEITAENVTFPTRPTAFQVVASQVPSFTIASENVSLVYMGLTNTSLGNAAAVYWGFAYSSNRTFINHIGTNGLDGVEIALNSGHYFSASWLPLDANDSLPVGAYLESQMVGTAGSVTNGVLGSQTCTKAGSSNYVIAVDYSPLGSSTHTLQVYDGTTLVAQMTGQSGSACATVGLHPWVCTINPDLDNGWPQATAITLNGGPTVVGTELLIIPEGGVPVSSISAARLLAANIPSLTLTNEAIDVNLGGLRATSVGNATLQTSGSQVAAYNLGSSGLDGVSFALPSGPGVDVNWQVFDQSNTLPAGAYLREQIIGTGGSPLGSVTMRKLCGACPGEGNGPCIPCLSNFVFSADFSPIGTSNYTVQAYLNGALVAQATNQSGAALAYCNIWGDSGCIPEPPIFGGGFDWTNFPPTDLPFVTFAGTTVRCDHLFILPENVSGTATALQLTASQVPAITFTGSSQSLHYQGLLHTSIGGASFSVASNQLTVANLDPSGQGGVEVDMGSQSDLGLNILPQWPASVGAVTCTSLGYINGQAGQPMGQSSVAFDGAHYTISYDFSAIGATTYTLQVYDGSQLVYQSHGNPNSGPACIAPLPPFKLVPLPSDTIPLIMIPCYDPPLGWIDFPPCVIALPNNPGGGTNVTGDRVVAIPENGTNLVEGISGARIQASGSIPQVVIAGESLRDGQVEATALGNTRFVPQGSSLTLANLGPSGRDGVSLALLNGLTGLATTWQDLDPSNLLVVGAYVEHQMIGMAGSVSNGVLGSAICTKAGISNYVISVDYSPLGSSTHTLQVYNGGTFVGQLTGQVAVVCATTRLPPGTCTINPFLNEEWPSPTAITLNGGPTLTGTELLMLPEGGATVGSLTAEQILTAEIPSLTITAETVLSATYGGLQQTPLGHATLALVNGSLTIGNLGSSGQDGVSMTLPQGNVGVAAHWLDLDPSNTLPVGAYLLQQMYGNAAGIANGLLGSVQVTKTGAGNYAVTANFPNATSPQCLVQVYSGNTLVASATNSSTGSLCIFPRLPFDIDTGTGPTFPVPDEGGGGCIGGLTWHGIGPIPISLNGAPVLGDMVLISSLSAPAVSAMTGLDVLASGIPQIVITNETSVAANGGLAHASLGNATLSMTASNQSTTVTVSNIGSRGDDGVSISFPGGLTSWGADWQDPDLQGRAPAGAYLQESVIGTGGSVTNGVLASLTTTKLGTSNYITTVDFSPMGASNFTAAVYNGTNLISQVGGLTNGTPVSRIDWSLSVHIYFHPFRITPDGSVGPINIDPDGANVVATGNYVVFTPDGNIQASPSILEIQLSQVPSLVITNEAVDPSVLTTKLTSNALRFQWLGNGVLQQSPNLTSWADSTNFVSPVTVPVGPANRFFRIRHSPPYRPF